MSEYIVEYPAWADGYINVHECINVHERIVRCKDCKRYDAIMNWCNPYEESREWREAEPNGYCHRGERREG